MKTDCTLEPLPFHPENRRTIQANFNGEFISSEGGALLLRETELQTHILSRLSHGFTDHRAPQWIEHSLAGLIKQRVYGLALGYEDLNDHDPLRLDPLLAVLCGKQDPLGKTRERDQDKGKALAGKSTLNRLELTPKTVDDQERYKKISADHAAMDDWLVDLFLESYDEEPEWMTLDVEATDDRVHGDQEGGYYSGYYRHDCYLPLYIFSGHEVFVPVCIPPALTLPMAPWQRVRPGTLKRVIIPACVVTSLHQVRYDARSLYEQVYCARGEMENRIKEQQLDLFADRTSTHPLYSNQLRLYFSTFAYVLLQALRRMGLQGTEMAQAQAGTIRLKLLKLGARITISVRRIRLFFSARYAWPDLFRQVLQQLQNPPARE